MKHNLLMRQILDNKKLPYKTTKIEFKNEYESQIWLPAAVLDSGKIYSRKPLPATKNQTQPECSIVADVVQILAQ